jgi:hypothetical protein
LSTPISSGSRRDGLGPVDDERRTGDRRLNRREQRRWSIKTLIEIGSSRFSIV